MDRKLDRFARAMASGEVSRRTVLARIGAFLGAAVFLNPEEALGAAKKKKCKKGYKKCGPSKCCPPGYTCKKTKKGKKTTYSCSCPKPKKVCKGKCISVTSDPKNCGACGKICGPGEHCSGAACLSSSCPTGQTLCAGACVDVLTDATHCGGCGTQCQAGVACVNGLCVMPETCTDGVQNGAETDVDCGGPSCPKCENGKKCNAASDCVSGVCTGGVCVQPTAQCSADVCGAAHGCPACANGKACVSGTDCTSGHCAGGVCVACVADGDCPAAANECQTVTCEAGVCGIGFVAVNTPTIAGQTAGDCKKSVCDGAGHITAVDDDSDAPPSGNPCQTMVCTSGSAHPVNVADTTPCGASGMFCESGVCVGCVHDTDCTQPGVGSCKKAVCSSGACVPANDDNNFPDDGNPCTTGTCVQGVPTNPPVSAGTACGGGKVCDDSGNCVQCVSPSGCPQPPNPICAQATCIAGHCGFGFASSATVASAGMCTGGSTYQQPTNCDGAGGTTMPVTVSCAPYVCGGSSGCTNSCTPGNDSGCAAGNFCNGSGLCVAKLGSGSACSANNQCLSGSCNVTCA